MFESFLCEIILEKIIMSKPIKPFQIRWNEPLGPKECPYMRRYVLNLKWFSVRLHIWYRSDDKRYMHNHAFNFWGVIIKGRYLDVSEQPDEPYRAECMWPWKPYHRAANHTHFVGWPEPGTITLLLCGPKIQNWGFKVNNKFMRPLRFFSRYGHPDCSEE